MHSTTRRWLLSLRVWCEAQDCNIRQLYACVLRSVYSYTLDNTLSKRLLAQQEVGNDEYRYLLRATIGWFRGISIGIVIINRVRAVATIAYCCTDIIAKMSADSHEHGLKTIRNRLSFEQYVFPRVDRYVLTVGLGLHLCRSMPIGLSEPCKCVGRCIMLNSIDLQMVVERHMHIAQLNIFVRVSIALACNKKHVHDDRIGCLPRNERLFDYCHTGTCTTLEEGKMK